MTVDVAFWWIGCGVSIGLAGVAVAALLTVAAVACVMVADSAYDEAVRMCGNRSAVREWAPAG